MLNAGDGKKKQELRSQHSKSYRTGAWSRAHLHHHRQLASLVETEL